MYESIQFETTCPFSRSHINCFKIDFHDFFSRVYTKSLGLPLFQILSWLLFHIPMMIQAGTLTKKKIYIYQYTYRLQEYIKQVYCLPELVFFLSSQIGTKMILLNQIKIRNSLLSVIFSFFLIFPVCLCCSWKYKLFVTPSRMVMLTGATLLGTCGFIAGLVGILHWREKVRKISSQGILYT